MWFWEERKQAAPVAETKAAFCRSCGRPVKFFPVMFGFRTRIASFPIDPVPDAAGKYYQADSGVFRTAGGELKKLLRERYRIAFYRSHKETCPVKKQ